MMGANEKITNIARASLVICCLLFVFMSLLRISSLINISWWWIFGVLALPYIVAIVVMVSSIIFLAIYRIFLGNGKKKSV